MSVSAPSLSAERAAPAPARWRSICAATVVSAPCLPWPIQAQLVVRKACSATVCHAACCPFQQPRARLTCGYMHT